MKEPSDRLRELRIKKKYETAADAANAFGWNANTYKSHENGERGIKPNVARKYAAAYGSTAAYILTGDAVPNTIQGVSSIPLEGIVAAGEFRGSEWASEDETLIPAVTRKGIPASKQYAVRIDGPSVNLRIADGMYAICAMLDSIPGGATLGSLVHVIRERDGGDREHTIKELRFTKDGPMLMPVSDDPRYQEPMPLRSTEHITITISGVVIGAYQPF